MHINSKSAFTGAFGVVHKGELVTSDGVIKAVAIKTIKCKLAVVKYI